MNSTSSSSLNPLSEDRSVPETSKRSALYVKAILLGTFLICAVILFSRLGHYALWDDEAMDALSARGILLTGDTKAIIGHNIVAYRNGLLLRNFRHEAMPPFTAYAAASSMRVFGQNSFGARFPQALAGLACVALMLYWVWKWKASPVTAAVFAIALLGNVSFFLYCRQCHYYGTTMFFFVAAAYLYINGNKSKGSLLLMGIVFALLMSANPSFFIILSLCFLADYLIWQRKVRLLRISDWLVFFVPQFIMGLVLLTWWNPMHTEMSKYLGQNTIAQRLLLFLWNWRDLNRCEMIVGGLLLCAPFLAFYGRITWLKRGLLALVLYVVAITILSTQTMGPTVVADVRYLSALLPLCIAIETFTLLALVACSTLHIGLAIPFAVLTFGCNFFYGGLYFDEEIRFTPICFANELLNPPPDPYTAVVKWINENVKEGESIVSIPYHTEYPLMFHAPKAIYGWQLTPPPKGQFENLPLIHFEGVIPPDYFIAFGPSVIELANGLRQWRKVKYQPVALLDCFWKDLYRPEMFWRSFEAVQNFNLRTEAIYIFKRTDISK